MVQYEECNMWRLVYSKYKLTAEQHCQLQLLLSNYSYSCGTKLADMGLGEQFQNVEIKDHVCGDTIEKLYYSAGFDVSTAVLNNRTLQMISIHNVKTAPVFYP